MPSADYNSKKYHDKQRIRVAADRVKIAARAAAALEGRVIPESGDLPIGVGRRITAAVLFLDICGFSGRPSSSLAEQDNLLRVLAFFFGEMIRIVEDYGGVVEKNTGDGLMAYFAKDGTLTASEAQRAVAAAMTMFHVSDGLLNPAIANSGIEKLNFRVCIDHGPITIASVGAARRFNSFVAIGATANIACKLLKLAGKNEILLGADMIAGLPKTWRDQLCVLQPFRTGFSRGPEVPYECYRFTGRWQGVRDD